MADAPKPAAKRVAVIDADGQFGTIDEQYAEEIKNSGGRVLTRQEQAERAVEAEYDKASTLSKISGAITGIGARNPTLEAWHRGGVRGATAGVGEVLTSKAADLIAPGAGKAYVDQTEQLKEASPTAYAGGEVAGMLGGAAAGAAAGGGAAGLLTKAVPSAGISAVGGAVEGGVGRALGGLATRGALGRAAVTAAEFGARGAVEGALYSGTEAASDAVLHDTDNAADKIFSAMGTGALYGGLGGAALGGAGSLLKSGVSAGLARVMRPAEVAEGAAAVQAGEATAGQVSRLRGASNEMAADALDATKVQARKALENVEGGRAAVGEYLNRAIHSQAIDGATGMQGAWRAGVNGRVDSVLDKINGDISGRISNGFDSVLNGNPARVNLGEVIGHAADIREGMLGKVDQVAGAERFFDRVTKELGAFQYANKVADDGTISAVDAFRARSAMARQAYELSKDSSAAGDAYKEFVRRFDKTTIDSIDRAAANLAEGPSNVGNELRHWKREFQLAKAAQEMAEGGVEKLQGNNLIGLRVGTGAAMALGSGHLLGAAALIGGELATRGGRGKAVAAYGLARLADRAATAQLVEKTNAMIGKASKGLLAAPAKGALPEAIRMPNSKSLARVAMTRVAEFQADPDAYIDKATRHTDALAVHSPEIASALVARQVQAAQFLASKVPVTPDPDPLDPHPAPKMTTNEEAELGRYQWYTEKPQRFFQEVAHGKMTFEGAETAQALMPGAFADLQQQTLEQLSTMMARGNKIPFRQRQYIGVLMDIAATPSQRPDHARFLQKNLEPLPDQNPPPMPKGGGASVAGRLQVSSYDRLESGGPGR